MKYFLILFLFSLFITACNQNEIKEEYINQENVSISKNSDYPEDSLFFALMNSIDNDSSLFIASSLNYTSNDGSTISGSALIDGNNMIHQLTSIDNDTLHETTFDYYYLNSKKRVSTELIYDYQKDSNYYHQIISFYDTSGTCIYTGFKYFEDLNLSSERTYLKADYFKEMGDQPALSIIQQQGSFETNFRGFFALEAYNLEFIKVGGNDGLYSSMLAISKESPLIKKIRNNRERYIGRPLIIEFTNVEESDGFSYQLLLEAKLKP
ncbi:MAG: hypothetical protein HOH34_00890 [Flavobacteriales bacterium]|nr:hypothetical protein [Flavobacteriales bacterium]